MSVAWSKGWPATTAMQATATVEAPVTQPWEFRLHQPPSDSWPLCPLPRFMEIAQTLRKEESMESSPSPVITGIQTQEIIGPYKVMGMAVMAARLLQNQTTGEMMMDIKVWSQGIMGLGLYLKVDEHPSFTLWELLDSNIKLTIPPFGIHPVSAVPCSVLIQWKHHDVSMLYSRPLY